MIHQEVLDSVCFVGLFAAVAALAVAAAAFWVFATRELRTMARPVIWVLWRRDTLISRLKRVPFAVAPRRTAAGCGWPEGGSRLAGTGTMPRACSAGSDVIGSCTGIAPLGKYGDGAVGVDGGATADVAIGATEKVPTVGTFDVGIPLKVAVVPYACAYAYGYVL